MQACLLLQVESPLGKLTMSPVIPSDPQGFCSVPLGGFSRDGWKSPLLHLVIFAFGINFVNRQKCHSGVARYNPEYNVWNVYTG